MLMEGKQSSSAPGYVFTNTTSRIIKTKQKQANKKASEQQLRSDYWFIKIEFAEKKAKRSHQYNRSYTLNCKRTTTLLYDKNSLF